MWKIPLKIFLTIKRLEDILKQSGFTYQMLTDSINDVLSRGIFPDSLKFSDITPVHKKDEATDKENYRPVSKKLFMINLVNIWKNT